jgi:hypothetical protein
LAGSVDILTKEDITGWGDPMGENSADVDDRRKQG